MSAMQALSTDLQDSVVSAIDNPSGLRPLGHAVLVEPYEPEIKSGIIELPDSVRGGVQAVEQRAVVVAVGPEAWHDELSPRAKPGDKVLVTKFAGFIAGKGVTKDGRTYRLVNDRDIFCGLE